MKKITILDTQTRWCIEIPDDVTEQDRVIYAWKRVLKLASKISQAGKKDLKVQIEIPYKLRGVLTMQEEPSQKEKVPKQRKTLDTTKETCNNLIMEDIPNNKEEIK